MKKVWKDIPEERFAVSRASLGFWLPARVSCDLQTSLNAQTSESAQVLPSTAKNHHAEPCFLLKTKLA